MTKKNHPATGDDTTEVPDDPLAQACECLEAAPKATPGAAGAVGLSPMWSALALEVLKLIMKWRDKEQVEG